MTDKPTQTPEAAPAHERPTDRLTRITTRTGDGGETGLGDGSRVSKAAPVITALGDLDELNAQLGVARCEPLPEAVAAMVARAQNDCFDIGAEVAVPGYTALAAQCVALLDHFINEQNATLPPLKEFVLPGGTRAAALLHVARSVSRRAERSVIAANAASELSRQYLNRLSDALFIAARLANQAQGVPEPTWQRFNPAA